MQINSKLRPAFAKAWFFRRTERKTQNSRLAVILPASWHTTSRLSCNNITWLWGSAKYFPTHLYNEESKIAIRIPIVVSAVPLFLGKTSIKSEKRARKSISRGVSGLKISFTANWLELENLTWHYIRNDQPVNVKCSYKVWYSYQKLHNSLAKPPDYWGTVCDTLVKS